MPRITNAKEPRLRLGYLVSHPIQYQAPLLRRISACPWLDLKVFFMTDFSVRAYRDPGFGASVSWDVPLLEGYASETLPGLGNTEPVRPPLRPFNYGIGHALRRQKLDALWMHGYSHPTNLRAIAAAKRMGVPVLVRAESQAGAVAGAGLKRQLKDSVVRRLFRSIDAFLYVGSENRRYYESHGVGPDRLFPMPYAVDNDDFQRRIEAARPGRDQLRQSLGVKPGEPIVLYASKLTPRKRAADLLRAWEQLSQGPARQKHLVVIGEGEERGSLEDFSRSNGLTNVHFLGFKNQSELPAYFELCDAFVLPSEREQWGLIVNEVMNAGKSIVVTDQVGCATDLVRNGENGFVYRTGDVEALTHCLRQLLEDQPLREKMGEESLRIIQGWGFEADIQGLQHALESLGVIGTDREGS